MADEKDRITTPENDPDNSTDDGSRENRGRACSICHRPESKTGPLTALPIVLTCSAPHDTKETNTGFKPDPCMQKKTRSCQMDRQLFMVYIVRTKTRRQCESFSVKSLL